MGNARGLGSLPWTKRMVFLPGEVNGQRSVLGHSPWGHTESDTTESLTLGFPGGAAVKKKKIYLPMQEPHEMQFRSLGWEDPLGEEMVTRSSVLAWRIPMYRGAWRATVHRVAHGRTQLSRHTS